MDAPSGPVGPDSKVDAATETAEKPTTAPPVAVHAPAVAAEVEDVPDPDEDDLDDLDGISFSATNLGVAAN
jgi:hypothetical protein